MVQKGLTVGMGVGPGIQFGSSEVIRTTVELIDQLS